MNDRIWARSLYICYFGLREPLVQTQVLPYLRELTGSGIEVHLLTFEPRKRRSWTKDQIQESRARLEADGIRWHSLAYHKRPSLPATIYDIFRGGLKASSIARRYRVNVLHARAHISAAMALIAKQLSGGRMLFDIRGFIPEEYVDAGIWRRGGLKYRLAKFAEKRCFNAADGFVVLTKRAREMLFPSSADADERGRPVEIIPCCIDSERFDAAASLSKEVVREEMRLTGRRVLIYLGALVGWYLADEMAELMAAAHRRDPSWFSLILTQSSPSLIADRLIKRGITERDFLIRLVMPDEVPYYLAAADIGLSFIKPCYSKQSSSPTKIPEYLAAGLPVVTNAGIGDTDELIERFNVGVVVRAFNTDAYEGAIAAALALAADPQLKHRCDEVVRKHFDLPTVGAARYLTVYRRIVNANEPAKTVAATV